MTCAPSTASTSASSSPSPTTGKTPSPPRFSRPCTKSAAPTTFSPATTTTLSSVSSCPQELPPLPRHHPEARHPPSQPPGLPRAPPLRRGGGERSLQRSARSQRPHRAPSQNPRRPHLGKELRPPRHGQPRRRCPHIPCIFPKSRRSRRLLNQKSKFTNQKSPHLLPLAPNPPQPQPPPPPANHRPSRPRPRPRMAKPRHRSPPRTAQRWPSPRRPRQNHAPGTLRFLRKRRASPGRLSCVPRNNSKSPPTAIRTAGTGPSLPPTNVERASTHASPNLLQKLAPATQTLPCANTRHPCAPSSKTPLFVALTPASIPLDQNAPTHTAEEGRHAPA